ncbi:transposase [Ammoniphilus resinae]|uniref:transposase n=1 Tax=Ammoniphilus resinae TaxID=861532 RepID=UPI001AE951A4
MGELSLEQFLSRYNTEEACADYLFQMKWPEGFVCTRCSHRQYYMTITRRLPLYECARCRYQASLTVGTVMEGSHTALQKWFHAIFLVSQPSPGISATALKKEINVTYKTAWLMLHKIRRAMSEADASVQLSGIVQVHDACYGRPYNPTHFTHAEEHPLLVGVNLNEQKEPTYIKMKLLVEIPREKRINRQEKENFADRYIQSEESQVEFITERLKPRKLKKGYPIFTIAQRWINETFHGIGGRHLQAYLDEFCYRLNRLLQKAPLFGSLIQCCASSKAVSYRTIVGRRKRFKPKQLADLPI